MPIVPLQPVVAHDRDSRAAVKLTDAELSPEQQSASMDAGFGRISEYLTENELALQNVLRQRRSQNVDRRIISDVGFRELSQIGLPNNGAFPVFQYIPPKAGQVLARKENDPPTIFVIHSFGGGFDLNKLRNRNVRSVAVDSATGFNPARYYNGVRELVAPGSKKSIHHIVSRRGDLTNSAPWDTIAFHGGGPLNSALQQVVSSINHISIGVELEEYFIRHGDERTINPIINRVPYTEEQYAVIAFLLKKYIAWTNNTEILKWLGPDTIVRIRNGESGCVIHRTFHPAHADPSAEFLFPQGFVKGDPIPAHLQTDENGNATAALYERRIELFWGHVPNGTPLSAWDRIFAKVEQIRAFDLNGDVFDPTFNQNRILLETPTITGTHIAAAANLSGRNTITQVQRSQALQTQSRATIYVAARTASNVTQTEKEQQSSKLSETTRKVSSEPIIEGATLFDYSTGQWVTTNTRNLTNG